MGTFTTFIKSFGLYFLGNILSKLMMFILLPIYTEYLAPEELGYYDVANTYLNLLITFLFIDIYVGIMRFVFDEQDKNNYYRPISNGIIIFVISLILYSLAVFTISLFYTIHYLLYIYIYGVCVVCNNLFGYLARTLNKNKVFAFSGVLGTFIIGGISIIGLLYFKGGIEVLYIASIIGLVVQILMLENHLHVTRQFSTKYYDKTLLNSLVKYSLPLSLNSLAYWFLTGYSNVAISKMLGLEENGIYVVAMKFGLVINLLSTCFNLAWQEIIFKRGNENKESLSLFYSKTVNLLISFLIIGALLLMHVSNIIFPFMVADSYILSKQIIPFCIIAAIINVISGFMGQIYAALKVTKTIVYSTFLACLLNVFIVPLFIMQWGLVGATGAIVISYLCNVIMRISFIRKTVVIEIQFAKLASLCILALGSLYVYYQCSPLYNICMLVFLLILSLILYKEYLNTLIHQIARKKS